MINRKALKRLSKDQLRGQWKIPVLITLLIIVIQMIFEIINLKTNENLFMEVLFTIIKIFVVFNISVMTNSFYLKISRGIKVSFSDIFISKKTYVKGIGIQVLMGILLIPVVIICGIILSVITISYFNSLMYSSILNTAQPSFTAFLIVITITTFIVFIPLIVLSLYFFPAIILICENSSRGIWECVKYSFKLMNGNVWSLFVLQLSFIGWSLLCIFTLGIGYLWFIPYMNTTLLNFYNEITDSARNASSNYNDITSLT